MGLQISMTDRNEPREWWQKHETDFVELDGSGRVAKAGSLP